MSLQNVFLIAGAAGAIGIAFGYFVRWAISLSQKGSVELNIKKSLLEAKEEAQKIVTAAEKKAADLVDTAKKDLAEKDSQLKRLEDRLIRKDELLDKRRVDLDKEIENIKEKATEIRSIKERVDKMEEAKKTELERVAGLTETAAKEEIIAEVSRKYEEDVMGRIRKLEREGEEKLDRVAKDILATSVQRLASATNSEMMSSIVSIPSDDIKGKIIGKEGRNIRAFERAAGVDVIVDDTPGAIVLSSFDPVRRAVAKLALENLIKDGRIQPAKIEEVVEKAKTEINKIIKQRGEEACDETGVINLDPRVIAILGRLHFRTSYGQNVLRHSIEMAHIAGMLATELGGDVAVAKAGALVHDLGKAVDHEIQGTHVEIGKRILQKFGADPRIIQAMQSHHEEYPYETLESILVQVADSISGGRPGARRDSVENYIKRLAELEAISNSFKGVIKSYAIQAGREVRVFVTPEDVSDVAAHEMAREMAKRIENELKYPGEIKVVIIRETRSIEYAR